MLNLLYIHWNVNPDAFTVGPFHVRYYGLMFIAAFAIGMYIFWLIIKRESQPKILLMQLLNVVFLSAFIGARLGDCLFYYPEYYLKHPWQIFFPFANGEFTGYQGLSSHGGAIGLLIGLYIFARSSKISYLWILDRLVIVVALAGFFIRIGNLMNSEIYGTVTGVPWGFIFEQKGETLPRHPTQIYEALAYLMICFTLGWLYIKKLDKLVPGMLLSVFLILMFSARFFIEYLKAPLVARESDLVLNTGQLLSLPFIFMGAFMLMTLIMRGNLSKSSLNKKL